MASERSRSWSCHLAFLALKDAGETVMSGPSKSMVAPSSTTARSDAKPASMHASLID